MSDAQEGGGGRAGRVVIVTGASSGIGRATAHLLAEAGDQVVLVSRSAEVLEEVRRECAERGGKAHVRPCDVADADAVGRVFDETVAELGRVDGVVHAAANLAYGRFDEMPAEVFDRIIATNVTGTANVARCALSVFRRQRSGRMVVLGSVLGKIAAPYMSPYATSKWALAGLVRTLQIEARATAGVDLTLVSPGGVNTPIYELAGSFVGRGGRPPIPVSPPEKVAEQVVGALDKPRRDVSVGWANPVMVFGFRFLPPVFDLLVTPLMRAMAMSREPVPENPGNVFEPVPEKESVRGRWQGPLGLS